MRNKVIEYKNSMIDLFAVKYSVTEFEARKLIREYDFNNVLKSCNYIALHDDPEIWVDAIYKWANGEREIVEM